MDLLKELLGCGEYDLQRAEEIASKLGIPLNEAAQRIRKELEKKDFTDPVACTYEVILQRAREKTGIPLEEKIGIYRNFLDTSFFEKEELSEEEEKKLSECEEGVFILKELGRL